MLHQCLVAEFFKWYRITFKKIFHIKIYKIRYKNVILANRYHLGFGNCIVFVNKEVIS